MVKLKILFSFMIRDMVPSAWVCSLILLGANTLISPVSAMSPGYDKRVKDPKTSQMQKRSHYSNNIQLSMRLGANALKQLLRRTRLLYTNGYDKVLVKAGGYKQAVSDFRSVDPVVEQGNMKKGEMMGSKGNLILKVSKEGESPKMSIQLQQIYQSQTMDPPVQYTIFYKRNFAMKGGKGT